ERHPPAALVLGQVHPAVRGLGDDPDGAVATRDLGRAAVRAPCPVNRAVAGDTRPAGLGSGGGGDSGLDAFHGQAGRLAVGVPPPATEVPEAGGVCTFTMETPEHQTIDMSDPHFMDK